jgi:hypothetical protein
MGGEERRATPPRGETFVLIGDVFYYALLALAFASLGDAEVSGWLRCGHDRR